MPAARVLPVVRDLEGLRELYVGSHRRLVAAVAALTGDVAEAEDCVQEAFARAVSRWRRLSDYDDPEAWVRHVAMNLARSRWRAAKRSLESRAGLAASVPALSVDHVALLAALRQLPEDQREAVVLHHLVDLPVEEVAVRQGAPVGTVKARLSRGRRALAEKLGMYEEVDVDE
jgi:RNA polymerase sigma-70 factor (ECF subfamily)